MWSAPAGRIPAGLPQGQGSLDAWGLMVLRVWAKKAAVRFLGKIVKDTPAVCERKERGVCLSTSFGLNPGL